ncbi:MAG: hypothetical protein GY853_02660 [PVC group bacterium]|nr:hypothetical protein [PVC group bacterium]
MCQNNSNDCLGKIASILGWCFVLGMGLLLYWVGMLVFAKDFVYSMHTKFLAMPRYQFNAIHYAGITIAKLFMSYAFLLPYIAIKIVQKKNK